MPSYRICACVDVGLVHWDGGVTQRTAASINDQFTPVSGPIYIYWWWQRSDVEGHWGAVSVRCGTDHCGLRYCAEIQQGAAVCQILRVITLSTSLHGTLRHVRLIFIHRVPLSLSPLLLYMPIIIPYSCYIGLYCTTRISSYTAYTGFATLDDAYDVMLGLHHNAKLWVLQLCFLQPPIATDGDGHSRFFAWQHIFGQRYCSLIDDDDCALHDINTAWMPLWHHCDTTYLSVSWLELLCNLFLPIVQSYAVEEYDTLVTRFFRYRLLWCLSLSLLHICSILVVCVCTNSTVVISRAFPRPIFSHSAISRPDIWCVIFMNSIFSQPVRRSSADAI